MLLFNRYLTKNLMWATLQITLFFTGVLFLLGVLSELKEIGTGDYHFFSALYYVLLRLPHDAYPYAPLMILVGCLVGLGLMVQHREIVVMRSSGYSLRQLMMGVSTTAAMMMLLATLLGEGLGPSMGYHAMIQKENAQNAGVAAVTLNGLWLHANQDFIHINSVIDRKRLEGVTWYVFNTNQSLQSVYHANVLSYDQTQWMMHQVDETRFLPNRTESRSLETLKWTVPFNTRLLTLGLVEPSEMSLNRLWRYANYLNANGLNASIYFYAFWERIFRPAIIFLCILLTVPLVLRQPKQLHLVKQVTLGACLGIGIVLMNAFLAEVAIVFQVAPMLAAFLPLLILAILIFFLFDRKAT